MNTDAAQRYARQIALAEIGPEGQERICAARVVVAGGDLVAETAALYLEAAGVGMVIQLADLPVGGAAWLDALAGVDVVVRSGFDDDPMTGAATRYGTAVVTVSAGSAAVEVVSIPLREPMPEASVDIAPRAAIAGGGSVSAGGAAVLAGALAAAEALHVLAAMAQSTVPPGRVRNLRLPLEGAR